MPRQPVIVFPTPKAIPIVQLDWKEGEQVGAIPIEELNRLTHRQYSENLFLDDSARTSFSPEKVVDNSKVLLTIREPQLLLRELQQRMTEDPTEGLALYNTGNFTGYGVKATRPFKPFEVIGHWAGVISRDEVDSDDDYGALFNDTTHVITPKVTGNLMSFMQHLPFDMEERLVTDLIELKKISRNDARRCIEEYKAKSSNTPVEDDISYFEYCDGLKKSDIATANVSFETIRYHDIIIRVAYTTQAVSAGAPLGFSYGVGFWKKRDREPQLFYKRNGDLVPQIFYRNQNSRDYAYLAYNHDSLPIETNPALQLQQPSNGRKRPADADSGTRLSPRSKECKLDECQAVIPELDMFIEIFASEIGKDPQEVGISVSYSDDEYCFKCKDQKSLEHFMCFFVDTLFQNYRYAFTLRGQRARAHNEQVQHVLKAPENKFHFLTDSDQKGIYKCGDHYAVNVDKYYMFTLSGFLRFSSAPIHGVILKLRECLAAYKNLHLLSRFVGYFIKEKRSDNSNLEMSILYHDDSLDSRYEFVSNDKAALHEFINYLLDEIFEPFRNIVLRPAYGITVGYYLRQSPEKKERYNFLGANNHHSNGIQFNKSKKGQRNYGVHVSEKLITEMACHDGSVIDVVNQYLKDHHCSDLPKVAIRLSEYELPSEQDILSEQGSACLEQIYPPLEQRRGPRFFSQPQPQQQIDLSQLVP